jgi:hypothetical protein
VDHDFSGLSIRKFEHMSQDLAQKSLGAGVSVFGDARLT